MVITARRIPDYRAARSARDDRIDFIGVGRIAPERGRNQRSAGVHEGTGRGTVACRKERPNRPREEDRNTHASRTTLPGNDGGASTQPGDDAPKARSRGPRRASANTQETKPCPSDKIRRDHLLTTQALSGKDTIRISSIGHCELSMMSLEVPGDADHGVPVIESPRLQSLTIHNA